MSSILQDRELSEKNVIEEMGLYIDGSVRRFSFCSPKTCNPNKQTTWNTMHLHEIAWNSRPLDYDKHFVVFYDIKK